MSLDEVPATARGLRFPRRADATIYYAGSASIDLFSSDTANFVTSADGRAASLGRMRRQEGVRNWS